MGLGRREGQRRKGGEKGRRKENMRKLVGQDGGGERTESEIKKEIS